MKAFLALSFLTLLFVEEALCSRIEQKLYLELQQKLEAKVASFPPLAPPEGSNNKRVKDNVVTFFLLYALLYFFLV